MRLDSIVFYKTAVFRRNLNFDKNTLLQSYEEIRCIILNFTFLEEAVVSINKITRLNNRTCKGSSRRMVQE